MEKRKKMRKDSYECVERETMGVTRKRNREREGKKSGGVTVKYIF